MLGKKLSFRESVSGLRIPEGKKAQGLGFRAIGKVPKKAVSNIDAFGPGHFTEHGPYS